MTNEEAMSNLEKLLQLYDDGMIDFSIIRESIKVALEALKAQLSSCSEIPNSSDPISRQAALDALRDAENHAFNSYYKGLIKAHKIIADLPSTQSKHDQKAMSKQPDLETFGVKTGETCADAISRRDAIDMLESAQYSVDFCKEHGIDRSINMEMVRIRLNSLPSAQPEVIQCHQCGFWNRETLRHQFNDFRDWNEAECLILAERDAYDEIDRYTEADDFCSRAERMKE